MAMHNTPYVKKLNTLEDQKKLFANFSTFIEKVVSENKSGVIKIIHPKDYVPVKNGFGETQMRNMTTKIKKPSVNIFREVSKGVWHAHFGFYKKDLSPSDILNLSKTQKYKAPSTDLKNLEKIYWTEKWSDPPVYASNVVMKLINSEDYNMDQLDTMLRYVQEMGL